MGSGGLWAFSGALAELRGRWEEGGVLEVVAGGEEEASWVALRVGVSRWVGGWRGGGGGGTHDMARRGWRSMASSRAGIHRS